MTVTSCLLSSGEGAGPAVADVSDRLAAGAAGGGLRPVQHERAQPAARLLPGGAAAETH